MALGHSSYYKPRYFPIKGTAVPAEIDRAQSIDPTSDLNRDKVKEIGRDGTVGYTVKSPTISYRLGQFMNGSIEFWQKLVGSDILGNSGQTAINVTDFKTSYGDICAYLTDDDGTFLGTYVYPALRTSGFTLNISDPQAIMEVSYDLVGEQAVLYNGANKYYIEVEETLNSAGESTIDLTTYAPAEDPDTAGKYMQRVVRVRAGTTTELVLTTDYTYSNATKLLTIVDPQASDLIKAYFTSAVAPTVQFTNNDVDKPALVGDCASIYLYIPASGHPSSADYLYKLQSVSLDVKFDREDIREIGNKNVVARGIKNTTITATLGKVVDGFSVEEVLRGVATNFGKIDVTKLSDQIALIIKIYDDNDKGTFKYGFKLTGLSPTSLKNMAAVNEYVKADATLEGEAMVISADVSVIGV